MDEKRRKEEGEARKSLKNGWIECLRVRMEVENGGFECEKWGERVWVRRRRGNDLGENGFSKLKNTRSASKGASQLRTGYLAAARTKHAKYTKVPGCSRSCDQGTSQLRDTFSQNSLFFTHTLQHSQHLLFTNIRSCEDQTRKKYKSSRVFSQLRPGNLAAARHI